MKPMTCIILMVALAAGCESFNLGFNSGSKEPEQKVVGKGGGEQGPIEVVINYADGRPARQIVQVRGSATVLEATRAVAQVETDIDSSGRQRVVAIGGDRNGERSGRTWVFDVNTLPQTGAANTVYVHPGDTLRWRYR